MIEIRKTEKYAQWLDGLRDIKARARIQARVERLATGNAGDVKPVGEGVSELRIDYGPGYRIYFTKRGRELVILTGWWRQKHTNRRYQNCLTPRPQFIGGYTL